MYVKKKWHVAGGQGYYIIHSHDTLHSPGCTSFRFPHTTSFINLEKLGT